MFDYLILAIIVLSFIVSALSTFEVLHITSSSSRGDPELSHGIQIRRWFMAMIGVANGIRFICSILLELYLYSCGVAKADPLPEIDLSLKVVPSLFYFTMYSLLTVYFGQLSFTVRGVASFRIRNIWIVTNALLYGFVIMTLFFHLPELVYMSIFVAYTTNLTATTWFSCSLFNFLPTAVASLSATNNRERIMKKLSPLMIGCGIGLLFNVGNYLYLYISCSISTFDIAGSREFLLSLIGEILPSLLFIWAIAKPTMTGEDPSLLTTVVDAASDNPVMNYLQKEENKPIKSSGATRPNPANYEAL